MSVKFTVLGSGSGGNAIYIETPETRLLVDAGFSGRQLRQRLAQIGKTPENLTGILITHEHSDHTQGLSILAARLKIPVICNRATQEELAGQLECPFACQLFATGATFEMGDIAIDTFSVSHDAQDPVGYLLRTTWGNIGVLTDLGHATKLVLERVRSANILFLEANHDVQMLQDDTRRPWSLKQRILSRHGHLSNDAAAEAAEQVASASLKHIYLGHLSQDCNKPEIARRVVSERLVKIGAGHIQIQVTCQSTISPTLTLTAPPEPLQPRPNPDSGTNENMGGLNKGLNMNELNFEGLL